jgi:polyadenylation factor subunit 2
MKFATCSDDVSIKIWDFTRYTEEITLTGVFHRWTCCCCIHPLGLTQVCVGDGSGHGWDVKCLDWHPVTSLLASGSKDNLVKLWDPKSGKNLTTMYVQRTWHTRTHAHTAQLL